MYLLFKSPENIPYFNRFHLDRIAKNYLLISLPILTISCLQIYLYFKGNVLIALAVNVILFCFFSSVLILHPNITSRQK